MSGTSQVVDLPSTVKVEVYPVEIFLCLHSNMDNVVTEQFSRVDTIRECCSFCHSPVDVGALVL